VGWGGSKSDSKAFGRLLCSRPKAKIWHGRSVVVFHHGGIWNLNCNVHILGASVIFAKLVKRERMLYIWLQSATSAAKPYTVIIRRYTDVLQQRCRVQPIDFTEEEVIRSKDTLELGEAEFSNMAFTLEVDDSKMLEVFFDFGDHDDDSDYGGEELFHLT
jgi:hypothetical protein